MAGRRQRRFSELDLQLEAISDILAMAREQTDPQRQAELLDVMARAVAACHEAHRVAADAGPHLYLVKSGAVAALLHPLEWLRRSWKEHRAVAVTAAAAVVGAMGLMISVWPDQEGGQEPGAAPPTASATSADSTPPPTHTHTRTSPGSSPSTPAPELSPVPTGPQVSEEPSPTAVGAEDDDAPEKPSPSPPGQEDGTDSEPPPGPGPDPDDDGGPGEPGPGDGGDEAPADGDDDGPGDKDRRRCLVELSLQGPGADIDRRVCPRPAPIP